MKNLQYQIKAFFAKNLAQKTLALFVAIAIWGFAPLPKREGTTEIQFFVPVSYTNLPKHLEITGQPPRSVALFVELPQSSLGNINPSQFQLRVDLSDADTGDNNFILRKSQVIAPKGVRVLNINPATLDISFENRIEKLLPIHPVFSGTPAKGYVVEKITLSPEMVLVHGPESKLVKVEQLESKRIDIDGLVGEANMRLNIVFPQGIAPVEPKPDLYTALLKVGSEPVNMSFENIPIGLVNQIYVTRINPKFFNIQLRGPKSILDKMKPEDIQAFINLQAYKPGNHKVKSPTLRVSPELQILRVWPPIDIWVLNQKVYE